MKELDENIVLYLLGKLKEAHPFVISRLLLLLDLEHLKETGKRATGFKYVFLPGGFYIDGLPPLLESLPGVEKVVIEDEQGRPVRGFFRLKGEASPKLPGTIAGILDRLIEDTKGLEDQELNQLVLGREEYRKLLSGSLPGWEAR
jgi:hypothetical protein